MIFRDPRRFGGIRTSPDLDTLLAERWSALGPDALSITPGQLRTRLSGADRGIKSVLLDQSVLAGMGNIYADEALFRAGIHPLQPARELSGDEVGRLVKAMRWVLRASIRGGGSTLRDYADANGKAGGYVARHAVYGRAAQPCVRCGQGLVGDTIAQRATVYCEVCQPRKVPI